MKKLDLIGQKFNLLTVVKEHPDRTNAGKVQWLCICDCGNSSIVIGSKLVNNWSKSCGCLQLEASKKPHPTHGMSSSQEYQSWRGMKKRCYVKSTRNFHRWGGRGITVCDQWINSFETFFADMGVKPSQQHSIERIENNGNYEPSNCKWGTKAEQARNRINNVTITHKGVTRTLSEWADELGISRTAITNRLKAGWTETKTVSVGRTDTQATN